MAVDHPVHGVDHLVDADLDHLMKRADHSKRVDPGDELREDAMVEVVSVDLDQVVASVVDEVVDQDVVEVSGHD